MNIIKHSKTYFTISGILAGISILSMLFWGLNFGIDFTGGSMLEVEFTSERLANEEVKDRLSDLELGNIVIQPIGEKGLLLRFKSVDEKMHQQILQKLGDNLQNMKIETIEAGSGGEIEIENIDIIEAEAVNENNKIEISNQEGSEEKIVSAATANEIKNAVIEKRFDSIGPVIGQELKQKTIYAIIIALIAIIAYIAWAFRHVSKPISSWKYGVIAILTLFHDVIITIGIFVFLGKYFSVEINAPFVAAIMTILGYSVNDTIVVFDRVRENLKNYSGDFSGVVNKSVQQTLIRSIYTSTTTLLVLFSLYFFGGETIKDFVLALIIGISIGTYSSIFLASPMLAALEKIKKF